MKNKLIVVMLLASLGYKNSLAQITQSINKPVITKPIVNTHQYTVTLSADSSNLSIRKFLSIIDSSINISCILEITGSPNDSALVYLQLFQRNSRSTAFPATPSRSSQPVLVVLNSDGYGRYNLNKDNRINNNNNREESQLSFLLFNSIQPYVRREFIGANIYKLGTLVIFKNKSLQDKTLESSIIF